MAGAPFLFGDGEADGLSCGVPVASGDGDADADSSGDGVGVGEPFFFFFLLEALGDASGEGVGEFFFFFFADGDELASGVSDGVGVALDFFFDEGEPDFSGDAVGVGVGDFSAVAFFFVFLCGVGVGASMLFSFVPNDCAAGARSGKADTIARHTSTVIPSKVEGPRETLRFAPDDTQFAMELLRQLCQHRFV